MRPAIFLSASVPDQNRDPKYYETADRIAIRDAVKALVTVAAPTMRLVWGGHPAITPLVRVVVQSLAISGKSAVRLFQSAFFDGAMPADNAAFECVVTAAVPGNRTASLDLMRREMISSEQFVAGVFIGGMEGVEEEFELFRQMHPSATVLPVASTGAAALLIFQRHRNVLPTELKTDLAYPSLFRQFLPMVLRN